MYPDSSVAEFIPSNVEGLHRNDKTALIHPYQSAFICGYKAVNTKNPRIAARVNVIIASPGSVLLSHTGFRAVPSAMKGLTSVFGMGTGVALSL